MKSWTFSLKEKLVRGRIRGIDLPNSSLPQLLAQYADDTSLTIRAEEHYVIHTVHSLLTFSEASRLVINWAKSAAYWWHHELRIRPEWTNSLEWTWVSREEVSKLLGTPFGLSLNTTDIDNLLLNKVDRKLEHWVKTKLNLAGRVVVANSVLISSMLYFLAIWGGSSSGIKRVEGKIRNFLWAGTTTFARAKVSWT